jgi:hypothetical protein
MPETIGRSSSSSAPAFNPHRRKHQLLTSKTALLINLEYLNRPGIVDVAKAVGEATGGSNSEQLIIAGQEGPDEPQLVRGRTYAGGYLSEIGDAWARQIAAATNLIPVSLTAGGAQGLWLAATRRTLGCIRRCWIVFAGGEELAWGRPPAGRWEWSKSLVIEGRDGERFAVAHMKAGLEYGHYESHRCFEYHINQLFGAGVEAILGDLNTHDRDEDGRCRMHAEAMDRQGWKCTGLGEWEDGFRPGWKYPSTMAVLWKRSEHAWRLRGRHAGWSSKPDPRAVCDHEILVLQKF